MVTLIYWISAAIIAGLLKKYTKLHWVAILVVSLALAAVVMVFSAVLIGSM